MTQPTSTHSPGKAGIFAVLSLLSGLIGLIFLISTLLQKPPLPNEVLSYFEASQGSFILFAITSIVWSVITIPPIVSLGLMIKNKENEGFSVTAILLTSAGILLNGIISFLYVGALLSIWSSKDISGANSEYQMSIWTNLFYFMSDPALMMWGFGQLILGLIMLGSTEISKWISRVTIIGGVAGVLTLAVFQTPILAILQELTLVILTFYFGFFLLKKRRSRGAT